MMKVAKYLFPLFYGGDDDQPKEPQQDDPANLPTADEVLDIQKNFVKKEDYDELETNYKQLVSSVLNGGDITDPNGEAESPKISDLRKELYDPESNLNNLEYVEKTLQLRKAIMEETGRDPFFPAGIKEKITEADAAQAERTAKLLQECVDEAHGDPEVFDIILSKKVI